MNRKFKRSTVLPIILLLYLIVMSVIGYSGMKRGETSPTAYWLSIAVTLGIIIALHFFLKKREQLRDERIRDIENSKQQ